MPSLCSRMDHGKEFNMEIGEYNVALEVNVVATIPNRYLNVTCVGNAESGVSENNRTITNIDIHGSVKDSVNTTNQFGAGGDSVTDKQKLIYSDSDLGTVNCDRHGESERLINTPPGWREGCAVQGYGISSYTWLCVLQGSRS